MKFSATFLLLAVSSVCLLQNSFSSVQAIPLDLLQKLNLKDEPAAEVQVAVAEDDNQVIYPREILLNPVLQEPQAFEDEIVEVPEIAEPRVDAVRSQSRAGECRIAIRKGLVDPQPVFLKTGSSEFYPYSNTGVMVVEAGKTMEMWCPSNFKSFATNLITASCVSGSTFRVNGNLYDFHEFTCKAWPGFVAQKTGASCNGGIMVRVGFAISFNRFAKQMDICFNEDEEVTRYVYHTLNPGSNYYQTGVDSVTFQTAGFFRGKNVDNLYTQNVQMQTINRELGGDGDKYFQNSRNIFLARGQMGAKADFVYADQQRATFLFLNAAPQWQVFNAGNWQSVEDGVRAWVSQTNKYVECYTGVWGVTTLANNRGVQTPLYLDYDHNHNGLIPVPKLYFRVVIEPSTRKGIVFIGVNNPHLTLDQIKRDYIICRDISDMVTYINWRKTDIVAGYSYACEVSEFRRKVRHLPALSAPGGLLI